MKKTIVTVGLIKGRHDLPVSNYIFNDIKNVFDFGNMEETIERFLEDKVGIVTKYGGGINQIDYTDVLVNSGEKELEVYVTGLTAATAELIRACAYWGVKLTLFHFDSATGEYVKQKIF